MKAKRPMLDVYINKLGGPTLGWAYYGRYGLPYGRPPHLVMALFSWCVNSRVE